MQGLYDSPYRPTVDDAFAGIPSLINEPVKRIESALNNAAFLNDAKTAITDLAGMELLTIPPVRLVTGSYKGTGTYGSSNKNSLTFPFKPQIVFVSGTSDGRCDLMIALQGQKRATSSSPSGNVTVSWSGNTIRWYNGDSYYDQLNASGSTYKYAAIG